MGFGSEEQGRIVCDTEKIILSGRGGWWFARPIFIGGGFFGHQESFTKREFFGAARYHTYAVW